MRLALAAMLLALSACGGAWRPAEAQPSAAWTYSLHAAGSWQAVSLDVCFPGAAPPALVAPWDGSAARLRSAHGPSALPLAIASRGRVSLAGLPPGSCATLDLDLHAAEDEPGWPRNAMSLGDDVQMLPTPAWLWRPERIADDPRVLLQVELPAGEDLALPFPCTQTPEGHSCTIDRTAFGWDGLAAFGRLERHALEVGGATFDVVRPAGTTRPDWDTVDAWLRATGGATSALLGHFPVAHLLVILAPVEAGLGDPVYYGYTTRGGGAAILFVLREDATRAELEPEWVAVHEMSHLALPVVPDADAWLSEGFATYYQEVLRARAGTKSAESALYAFADGCDRADQTSTALGLAEESATVHRTHRYARVYWGGAATMLALELAFRAAGTSLDARVRLVQDRAAREPLGWDAARVVATLDEGLARPVAGPLVARLLRETRCPLAPSLAALGVTRDASGRVLLSGDADAAALRDAVLGVRR